MIAACVKEASLNTTFLICALVTLMVLIFLIAHFNKFRIKLELTPIGMTVLYLTAIAWSALYILKMYLHYSINIDPNCTNGGFVEDYTLTFISVVFSWVLMIAFVIQYEFHKMVRLTLHYNLYPFLQIIQIIVILGIFFSLI